MEKTQAKLETLATACWLLMDLFWMLGKIVLASLTGMVTLGLQLIVFRYLPRTLAEWAVNAAISSWVLMNLLWMLGEAYERPALIQAALASVTAGLHR